MTQHRAPRRTPWSLVRALAVLALALGWTIAGAPTIASPAVAPGGANAEPMSALRGRGADPISALGGRGNPDAYKFFAKVGGEPIHWSPCQRIGWRINMRRAPQASRPQAKEALRRLNAATGLRFRFEGRTRARPNAFGENYPRDTELVMGWSTPARSQLVEGQAGVGGPGWSGSGEITSGFVLLNAKVDLAPGFGRGPKVGYQGTVGQLMLHELGHAVGLDHVQDDAQIMHSVLTRKPASWGAGDKNGLRRVGKRAGCFG